MQGKYIGASCELTSPIPSEQPCQNADLAVPNLRFQTFTQEACTEVMMMKPQGFKVKFSPAPEMSVGGPE